MKPKGTILIVDDNEAMLTSLKILLHDVFATVCTTPHPHTIPSMLRAERPDVVLLDMNFGRETEDMMPSPRVSVRNSLR